MNIDAYHGSLTEGITLFRPAAHFGDRKQALSAIGAKRFLDGIKIGEPIIYKVTINAPEKNIFSVRDDWGKHGAWGALLPLRTLQKNDASQSEQLEITKRFNKYFRAITDAQDEVSQVRLAEELLLREAGGVYKVIKYDNKVEGCGEGFCVINPSAITIESVTRPSWPEVIDAFKHHSDWRIGEEAAMEMLRSIQHTQA